MPEVQIGQVSEQEAFNILRRQPDGPRHFYLFVQFNDGVIRPALVQVFADHLDWVFPPLRAGDRLYDLWCGQGGNHRWNAVGLEIRADTFEAHLDYGPCSELTEESHAETVAAISARFPGLPLHYPPVDEDAMTREMLESWKFELNSPGDIDPQPSDAAPD